MLAWRLSDEPPKPCPSNIVEGSEEDAEIRDPAERAKIRTTIFLGCTSNLLSAGTRDTVRSWCERPGGEQQPGPAGAATLPVTGGCRGVGGGVGGGAGV